MTTTELRRDLHSRINHLNEAQLQELRRIVEEKFPSAEKEAQPKKRPFGLRKGSLKYMADDFDTPLEDFKDYMPE